MHTDVIPTNKRHTHAQSNYTNTKLKAWFRRLLRHPARKRSGSILHRHTPDLHRGTHTFNKTMRNRPFVHAAAATEGRKKWDGGCASRGEGLGGSLPPPQLWALGVSSTEIFFQNQVQICAIWGWNTQNVQLTMWFTIREINLMTPDHQI